MTYNQACQKARTLARQRHQFMYVFLEDRELDDWQPGTSEDADAFFFGLHPVIAFDENGDVA